MCGRIEWSDKRIIHIGEVFPPDFPIPLLRGVRWSQHIRSETSDRWIKAIPVSIPCKAYEEHGIWYPAGSIKAFLLPNSLLGVLTRPITSEEEQVALRLGKEPHPRHPVKGD